MLIMAVVYWKFTQDCPEGNYSDLRARGMAVSGAKGGKGGKGGGGWASFKAASANYRVWLLFITYGACFGVEIFIHNVGRHLLRGPLRPVAVGRRHGCGELRPAGAVRPGAGRLCVGPLRQPPWPGRPLDGAVRLHPRRRAGPAVVRAGVQTSRWPWWPC